MHPNEIHHINAYIVFTAVSITCIGLLIYLYLPTGTQEGMRSSVMNMMGLVSSDASVVPAGSVPTEEVSIQDQLSGRRMRLTQILLRAQKELQTLEDQRKSSSQGLDPVSEQKIKKLREKIATMEKMITEMK